MKKIISIVATLAVSLLQLTAADAQVTTYIGATGAAWETTTNWSLGAVPTSGNDVFVDNSLVRISSAAVANNLTIGGTGAGTVQLRRNGAYSLTVGGSIVMAPGAGAATLQLGVSSGGSSTLTIAGGTGSIVDGGGAGATDIAVFGPVTVNLRSVTVDTLNLNQNGSGSLTIGAGQNWTIVNTLIGGPTTNITHDLTVSGTLNSTNIKIGDAVVAGTNRGTLNLETGGVILAQTLQRSNAMDTVFNWNGGTIQNKSGVDLSVQGSSTNTLTVSLAGTGTHSFNADSGRTITVASSAVLADKAGENGTLAKSGAGTLILQGANTYTGATTVSGGSLQIGGGGTTGAVGSTSGISLASGVTLAFNRTDDYGGNFDRPITGLGGITLKSGTLTLSSTSNNFSGPTTINNGTLKTAVDWNGLSQASAITLADSATAVLDLNGKYAAIAGLNGGGAVGGNVINLSGELQVGTTGLNSTYGGSIAGIGHLRKVGNGTMILTGSQGYTGETFVDAGTLQIGNGAATGAINSTFKVTVASGGTLAFNRSDNYGGNFTRTISGSGTVAVNSGTLALDAPGSSGYSSSLGFVINNGGSVVLSHSDTFGGTGWDATASPAFTINAGGVLSSNNSYNTLWNATLNGGTLRANGGANAPAQAFALAGTLTVGGSTASLIESGTIGNGLNNVNISGSGNNVLTMNVADVTGNSNADLTITAGLQNNRGTLSNLTKTGAGTVVLSGSNIYTGTTTISAGVLQVGNGGTAGSIGSTSGISVASGATLAFNRSDNYGGNFTRLISGSGSVVLSSGTLTLQNTSNTFTGGYTVNGGVLSSLGQSVIPSNSVTVNSGGTFGMASTDTWGNAGTTSTPAITINTGGNLTTDNQFNSLRNLTLAGGTVTLNGGLNAATGALVLGGTVAVNGATTSTLTVTTGSNNFIRLGREGTSEATEFNVSNVAGTLAANAPLQNNFGVNSGLTKSGVGTMTLTASNGYTGATTISAGILRIGSGGSAGSIDSTSIVSVASGATLAFNRSDNYGGAFDRQITGSGAVTLSSGTLVLTNNDTYSGATTISAGTLQIGNSGTSGAIGATSGVSVASGATLAFNRSDNYGGNFTRTISGSGTVAVNSGTLALDAPGSSGYSSSLGFVINNGGSVVLSHSDTFGGTNWDATASPAFTINAGGVLSSNNSYNTFWNATLNGGTLRANGGANAPAQAFALAGTLTVGGSTASLIESGTIGNGLNNVNISGNGNNVLTMNVADVTGNSNADLTITAGLQNNRSTLSNLTKTGLGTLVLSGSNSYTGATTISAGILSIGSANGLLGTSGVSIAAGAGLTYTGGATTFGKNITISSGTGTVRNSGAGTLALSGTLTKNGTVLRLTGGSFNVTGQIVGTNANSDLLVDGTSTVTLSSANTYNGPTFVNQASNLVLGINNAIPSGSVVTLGNATTTGTLTAGSFTNALGGLAFGAAGGTLKMTASATSAAQLTAATGTMTLTNGTLDLAGSGTSAGLYRLLSAQSIGGSFASVTGSSAAYKLVSTSTSVDYQQRAVLGAVSVTNPSSAIITGGSAAFTFSVANGALSGGETLSFTAAALSNVSGSASGSALGGGSSGSLSGFTFTGTSVGSGQNGTFTVSAPAAYGSTSATGTVSVTVLDHATSSLSGAGVLTSTSLDLGTWDYSQNTWTSGSNSAGFSIYNLASTFGAGLTADLSLVSVSGTGNGFTTNLSSYADIAGGNSGQYWVTVDPTNFLTSGTQSWIFTIGMSDKTGMSGAQATNTLTLTANVIVVPEPGALALAGLGIAAAAWALRRRT